MLSYVGLSIQFALIHWQNMIYEHFVVGYVRFNSEILNNLVTIKKRIVVKQNRTSEFFSKNGKNHFC